MKLRSVKILERFGMSSDITRNNFLKRNTGKQSSLPENCPMLFLACGFR